MATSTFSSRPIRELPQVVGQAIADSARAAKDWAVAHKKEILIAIAAACSAFALLGIKMMAAGLSTTLTVSEKITWGWPAYTKVTKTVWEINKKFLQGALLALGSAIGARQAWNLSQSK